MNATGLGPTKKPNDTYSMKKTFLMLLFLMSLTLVKAQEKIITIRKDTISCRIISVGTERISYEQKNADDYVVGQSIAIADVLQYFRSGQSLPDSGLSASQQGRQTPEHPYQFSFQGGLSYLTNDFSTFKNSVGAASGSDEFIQDLKNGYYFGLEFYYLLKAHLGLGLTYSFSEAVGEGDLLLSGYTGTSIPTYLSVHQEEKMYTHFIGPSILFQQFVGAGRKIKITETLSPGIVIFRDESRGQQYEIYWGDNTGYSGVPPFYIEQANSVTTGKTIGGKGGLAVEYYFTSRLSAGISGNFMWAEIGKASFKSLDYEVDDQKLDSRIDISRIDYGFSVRYNF